VVIVLRVDPEQSYMVFPQAGSVIPCHTSGIGKVLLAGMEPDRRDRVLADCSYPRLTDKSIDNRDDFITELDRVRLEGIAFDREESVIGLSCVSAPVFNNKGQCLAAFSVSGNAHAIETKREEIISAVSYVSSRISSQLGYRKPQ
jgi:IclR family transcriptional regulator, KDG regulon repressor